MCSSDRSRGIAESQRVFYPRVDYNPPGPFYGLAMNQITQHRNLGADALLILLAAGCIAVGGILAGLGDIRNASVVAATVAGAFLLVNLSIALHCLVISSLVLVGVIQLYFPELQLIRWSIALSSAVLGGVALLDRLFLHPAPKHRALLAPISWWLIAFFSVAMVSSVLNYDTVATFAYGFKGYFQIWGLFFAIVLMNWRDSTIDALPRTLVWIALIQLPFVLHEYFFLVPTRVGLGGGVVAEDVVAGTLGASATGGGANAVLSLLLITALAILTALYKQGILSPGRLFLAAAILLLPVFLNANRISLVYILLAYCILFSQEIMAKPGKTLIVGAFSILVLLAVFWSYSTFLSRSRESGDFRTLIVNTFASNVEKEYGYGDYDLNRFTTIAFWYAEHKNGDLSHILFGHGIGESREAVGGVVEANTLALRVYPNTGIGLTSVSAVLWELGISGLAVLTGLFWSSFSSVRKLARAYRHVPWRCAVFQGLQVAVVALAISMFHKNTFVFYLPYQALLLTIMAYIAYWHVRMNEQSSGGSAGEQA